MRYTFPKDFWWGSATSAPQSEGASSLYGKGESIWDLWFREEPQRFHNGVGPEHTSTFYQHYKDDIALLPQIGHNTLRTSISWSRLIPNGVGEVNPQAVDFYNRVIDELIATGIQPFINLYHFDMPVAMQEKGGWESREVVDAYAEFAMTCFKLFGDRVKHWFTFNEPIVPVEAGYLYDFHYPCVQDFKRAVQVAYNTMIAHALAVKNYKSLNLEGEIGIILNLTPSYPRSGSPEDVAAAELADLLFNRSFLDPAVKGAIPTELKTFINENNLTPSCLPDDEAILRAGKVDLLAVNYYQPRRIKAKETVDAENTPLMPESFFDVYIMPGRKMNPHRGWEIYEKGIYDLLTNLRENYGNIRCFISENGMGVEGEERFLNADGRIEDDYRIEFVRDHLIWVHKALQEGSNCKGYHMWTFIDCWSWCNAYKNRYGFIHLDLATQKRHIKKSGYWFANVAKQHGFD